MAASTCRDCGNPIKPEMRGCPRCALNLEAEAMIDRFIWRRLFPALIIFALVVIAGILYMAR